MVNFITENIDIWTAAQTQKTNGGRGRGKGSNDQSPHGTKKLRELILELAVRGKLVPQNPKDESASVLMKRIAKEKAILFKKGKIRKQKSLPEINNDEKPFELPDGWEWVRLCDIGNIFNGNSVSARIKEDKYTDIDGGLPFIATKDVSYGWDSLSYDNGVSIPLNEPKFKVAHRRAVLICSEGGSAGKKCGITDQDICFGNKLFAIELYGRIESDFILANYLSPTFVRQFSEKMTGIIGGISAANFNQLLVPIPPLSEQHRIVAKVYELMTICDQLEQQQADCNTTHQSLVESTLAALTNAANQVEYDKAWQRMANNLDTLFTTEQSIDQLIQTILQLAVMGKLVLQDPNDEPTIVLLEKIAKEKARLIKERKIKKQKPLPEITDEETQFELAQGWEWVRFGELVNSRLGKMLDKAKNKGVFKPYLRNTNVQWDRFDLTDLKEMRFEESELDEFKVQAGDLLICEGGEPGRCAIWREKNTEIYFQKALHRVRTLCGIMPEFLQINLMNDILNGSLAQYFTGATIKHLPGEKLAKYLLPVAPIEEQHRIVAKVDELMALCDILKARLNDSQTIQVQLADTIIEQAVA